MTAAHELGEDDPPARQADLAAVGVAAEIEGISGRRGMVRHLGRVDEGDAEPFGFASSAARAAGVVEGVNVVQAGDADRSRRCASASPSG